MSEIVIPNFLDGPHDYYAQWHKVVTRDLDELRNRSYQTENAWVWDLSDWMAVHYEVPFFATVFYVLFVYFGQNWMAKRAAFHLKGPLAVWNGLLAVFSICGTYMCFSLFFYEWFLGRGFLWEICHGDLEVENGWIAVFCLSKIPELGDTVFIVLRKRPLKFLQFYHHIVTLWFTWAAWCRKLECGGAYAIMNYMVHSVMYTYFMCSALDYRWPEWLRKSITYSQISQMVFGLIFVVIPFVICPGDIKLLTIGFIMYLTYFYLFALLLRDMSAETRVHKFKTDEVSESKKDV